MIKLLLDTSYCLFLIRERPQLVQVAFERYQPGEIGISSLTIAALEAYARRSSNPVRNRQALTQFLMPLKVADFDAESAHYLGRIGGETGFDSGTAAHAMLLAAQALRLGAVLVTAQPALYAGVNELHFRIGLGMEAMLPPAQIAPASIATAPHTIRMTGSHDLSLTLLGDWLHAEHPGLRITAANVGSLSGLTALLQHEAHLAGSHLLDEETGEFNVGPVRRLMEPRGLHVVILGFVERIQGILVRRGNPKQIEALEDLRRDDVLFVNRQRGSGTRILLDYRLRVLGVEPQTIDGYEREETTHLAVATAIAQGAADCGMGIQAAAQALNLDFIPVIEERFDLVIPVEHFESALLAPLLTLLRRNDSAFRDRVTALGGYNTQPMGRVLAEV
jgi:putative molybdopterin biosynthesis protein